MSTVMVMMTIKMAFATELIIAIRGLINHQEVRMKHAVNEGGLY